ncbi:hypothetical protein ACFE04_001178 [Oxalis oulophora]
MVLDSEDSNYLSIWIIVSVVTILIIFVVFSWSWLRRFQRQQASLAMLDFRNMSLHNGSLAQFIIPVGIDEATIQSYPKFSYTKPGEDEDGQDQETNTCSICLSNYVEKDMIRVMPGCGHRFHMDCLDFWLRMSTTCPICRHSPADRSMVPSPFMIPQID